MGVLPRADSTASSRAKPSMATRPAPRAPASLEIGQTKHKRTPACAVHNYTCAQCMDVAKSMFQTGTTCSTCRGGTCRTNVAFARRREGSKAASGVGLALQEERRKRRVGQQHNNRAEQQRRCAVRPLHQVPIIIPAGAQRMQIKYGYAGDPVRT